MISISEFRKFVTFIERKIQPLATQYEEFRSAAQEVLEKAREIEGYVTTEEIESESLTSISDLEVHSDSHSVASSVLSRSEPSEPQQVKRRKTRVQRKINQVCTAYFAIRH